MSKQEEAATKKELKPKVTDDDLVEILQAKADNNGIKTAASGLKAIREDGYRVAQKRVYVAFKSVVIPATVEEDNDDDDEEDAVPAVADTAEEVDEWDEEE